jgi:hypothetical protein
MEVQLDIVALLECQQHVFVPSVGLSLKLIVVHPKPSKSQLLHDIRSEGGLNAVLAIDLEEFPHWSKQHFLYIS